MAFHKNKYVFESHDLCCISAMFFFFSLFIFFIEDFPEGTWLGDENNPEMRVRCPVSQADMLHISTNCRTPEKMALTLLDYLFHREVQAMSNLSGQGKHGKKQLDPLMIYGIRCEYYWTRTINHLIFRRPAAAFLLVASRLEHRTQRISGNPFASHVVKKRNIYSHMSWSKFYVKISKRKKYIINCSLI